jgi:hypothetical protein
LQIYPRVRVEVIGKWERLFTEADAAIRRLLADLKTALEEVTLEQGTGVPGSEGQEPIGADVEHEAQEEESEETKKPVPGGYPERDNTESEADDEDDEGGEAS